MEQDGRSYGRCPPEVAEAVGKWLRERKGYVDAAVWTGLASNWRKKRCQEFSAAHVLEYLEELCRAGRSRRAEEYIRKAPRQIRTEVRQLVEERFGWYPESSGI